MHISSMFPVYLIRGIKRRDSFDLQCPSADFIIEYRFPGWYFCAGDYGTFIDQAWRLGVGHKNQSLEVRPHAGPSWILNLLSPAV